MEGVSGRESIPLHVQGCGSDLGRSMAIRASELGSYGVMRRDVRGSDLSERARKKMPPPHAPPPGGASSSGDPPKRLAKRELRASIRSSERVADRDAGARLEN